MFLSKSNFSQVVKNSPLVSIDLCILRERKILLGKRINPPAKDFYFVPGGRIFKSELRSTAIKRILRQELGLFLEYDRVDCLRELGCYEHFYDDNFLNNNDFGTHYIVLAYLIPFEILRKNQDLIITEQHSKYIWVDVNNIKNSSLNIHINTLEYFKNPILRRS